MGKLKYSHYDVVLQEVPGEISLVFNITGCPHHCVGCHSEYLHHDFGYDLAENYQKIIHRYEKYITCVCFMGGDWRKQKLRKIIQSIKKNYDLKVCLYTAAELEDIHELLENLEYVKTGKFILGRGGLDSEKTNQRFYRVENGKVIDETFKFRKRGML